jgi:hypothetical protein
LTQTQIDDILSSRALLQSLTVVAPIPTITPAVVAVLSGSS